MNDDLEIYTISPGAEVGERRQVQELLSRCGLDYEEHIQVFVICRSNGKLIACAGLDDTIVKCVAIEPDWRGGAISLTLMSEVANLAYERGHSHLFLYTRPDNVAFFEGCGFHPLVEVPSYVTLMENTPVGIRGYCDRLSADRQPGKKIGGIVVNANPFTYGHQYLISMAAEDCDWLHVFVVGEDVSLISYRDRYELVRAGIRHLPNVTLHHGSQYMISRATFPDYFFKEKGIVGDCCTAIDLLMFRNFIAPALGITHRYVGTEPFCSTTRKYNEDMKHWLQLAASGAPPIEVIEEERKLWAGTPISASEVRRLLRSRNLDGIIPLVPPATYKMLLEKYVSKIASLASDQDGGRSPRLAMAVGS